MICKTRYSGYLRELAREDLFHQKLKISSLVTIANSTEKSYFLVKSGHSDSSFECDADLLRLFLEFQNKKTGLEVHKKFAKIITETEFVELLSNWLLNVFLLPINKFDYYLIDEAIKSAENNHDEVSITIVPTMDCNFRCVYCFEEHIKGKMTHNVINHIETFLKDEFNKLPSHVKKLRINYYGGEPLLAKQEILKIVEVFDTLTSNKQFDYIDISMITNGYMIDENFINFARKMKLKSVQITIDGTKEEHDKRRVRPGNKPTFDKIINGIIIASKIDGLHVGVRANVDSRNYNSLLKLPNILAKRIRDQGGNIQNVSFSFDKVQINNDICNVKTDNTGFILNHNVQKLFNNLNNAARKAGFPTYSEIDLKRKLSDKDKYLFNEIQLRKKKLDKREIKERKTIIEKKLEFQSFYSDSKEKKLLQKGDENIYSLQVSPINCSVHYPYTYVILPDGTITKCWENLNVPEFTIGNIFTGIDKEKHKTWFERRTLSISECWGCKEILICGGGCASKAFYKFKTLIAPGCFYKSRERFQHIIGNLKFLELIDEDEKDVLLIQK